MATVGRIVKGIGGFYYVRLESGEVYECKAKGLFRKEGLTPMIGDLAEIEILPSEGDRRIEENYAGEARIERIIERKNSFIRPPVSNVDVFVAVFAAKDPEPIPLLIDSLLVTAERAEAEVVLCMNKADLVSEEEGRAILSPYAGLYDSIEVSALEGRGVERLKEALRGKTAALTGPSGVGKSSIINLLHPKIFMETGEVSEKTRRGRHTTRHAELFYTDFDALVFDTPGFSAFELPDMDEGELCRCYPEMAGYLGECRYDNCRHDREPMCAVREAVDAGEIAKSRYASYLAQLNELRGRRKY